MRKGNAQIIFLSLLVLAACSRPLPALEDMNMASWKADRHGCKHERQKMMPPLRRQTDKLKGLSEDDIIRLLGRPDQNELWKRNQKFFKYNLSPAKSCGTDTAEVKLSIRFNAMNLAKEVAIETTE